MSATYASDAQWHQDASDDSGVAYKVHGRGRHWHLECAWCPHEVHAGSKREALADMTQHYESLGVRIELH